MFSLESGGTGLDNDNGLGPRPLNEFENFVLALIARGFETASAIRAEIGTLPWVSFSTQSGSIYRVARRLASRQLIEQFDLGSTNAESRWRWQITETGRNQVRNWMFSSVKEEELVVIVDPLLSRITFLPLLDDADQLSLLEWLYKASERHRDVALQSSRCAPDQNPTQALACEMYMAFLEKRVETLRKACGKA